MDLRLTACFLRWKGRLLRNLALAGLAVWVLGGLQSLNSDGVQETVAGSHIGGRSWLLRLRMIDLEYPALFFEVRGGLHALNSPSLSCHA